MLQRQGSVSTIDYENDFNTYLAYLVKGTLTNKASVKRIFRVWNDMFFSVRTNAGRDALAGDIPAQMVFDAFAALEIDDDDDDVPDTVEYGSFSAQITPQPPTLAAAIPSNVNNLNVDATGHLSTSPTSQNAVVDVSIHISSPQRAVAGLRRATRVVAELACSKDGPALGRGRRKKKL